MALFCAGTVVFLLVRDLALPEVRNTEVWLGLELRGAAARATAPLHWALYGGAAWAFWRERPWIWPAAIGYSALVAVSHLVWNLTSPRGGGLGDGLWQLGLFLVPTALLGLLARGAARDRTDGPA